MAIQSSIKTAASHLANDFIESASFTARQVSACDYGVLDNSGACAIVIQPLTSSIEWGVYDGIMPTWGMRVEAYIKDTGNPCAVLTRVWDIHDVITEIVTTGSTINTLHRSARPVSFSRPPDSYIEFNGTDYLPVYVTVEVKEEA
jgi:hypothetical protein